MPALRPTVVSLAAGLALAAGCQSARTTPGTAAGAAGVPAAAQPAPVAERPAGAAPADTTRPRRRPDPRVQDSLRRNMVAQILKDIAGRENEPAGQVFKNVKLLKDLPARELLRTMDEQYGRGLGWTCSNCHVPNQWASDDKKNKHIAREMQQLTDRLNTKELPAIPQLDEDFDKVSCVTCHRGSTHPANTMPVPPSPASGDRPPAGGR